jgi:hypothetical protein
MSLEENQFVNYKRKSIDESAGRKTDNDFGKALGNAIHVCFGDKLGQHLVHKFIYRGQSYLKKCLFEN